ncbi:MAG: glutaredoxin family protein [Candidatus Paceibacterota bacterium]|jgi:glutaredoxin-like YruB-family protein
MKKVAIYTTPTCVYCNMAKKFFQENKVEYEEYNVATDLAKRQEMMEATGQMGVPVIKVGDDVVVGFNQPRIRELLGMA